MLTKINVIYLQVVIAEQPHLEGYQGQNIIEFDVAIYVSFWCLFFSTALSFSRLCSCMQ